MAAKQDFIKGWPSRELLEYPALKDALKSSFTSAIDTWAGSALNYGTAEEGAFMLGHPVFIKALCSFLADQYGLAVEENTIMSTSGASMTTDIISRVHAEAGDIAVTEAPTYYLAHQIMRERGLELAEVPIEADGMDLDALDALCKEKAGKVKLVYTVPIHHNPTGVTMSKAKRVRLAALAREHKFYVIADEAYQLVSFTEHDVKPLYYEDDASDPRIFSVGTFSKVIGPGVKVGWAQAHPDLLKPMTGIGFINSGNNPVIFSSCGLAQFIEDGSLKAHLAHINAAIGKKCETLSKALLDAGLEFTPPTGGYFCWVQSKGGKMTGRSGKGMTLDPPEMFEDYMRLCFAWLTEEQLVEGVQHLKDLMEEKSE